MNHRADMRIFCTVLILLLCIKESVAIFFNKTSRIELKPFNISKGFTLTFKTCDGGTLLQQDGAGTDYYELYVVPGSMNYTSLHFTPSTLVLKWRTASITDSVHVGNELDQSKPYYVSFMPGVKHVRNTTLSVSIGTSKPSTVHVADTILDIISHGNMTLGSGFIGCIDFGAAFNIAMDSLKNVSISEKCLLKVNNVITSCKRKKCPVGFKGYYCEENIDDCASLPCHHASKCIDEVANYTCECGAGWYGRKCDKLKDKKLCDYKPCQNGGICHHISDFNNYTCTCQPSYSGRNCSKIMDLCESNPCFNNGTCRNITATYYECDCHQGFGGKTCEVNIDDCAGADCGRGMCVDGISNHSCNCSGTGYNGTMCKNDINECDVSPCDHNGTCSNYGGGYKCECIVGYSGKNCENNIDDCASRPCKNGGNCTDSFNDFSCHCPPGFSGKSCESKLHPCNVDKNCSACDSDPCQHGDCNCTCTLYAMHYNCTCDRGYRGMNCSEDIDECTENGILCHNNGTCENQEGGFRCKCQEDYTGKYCNETKSICHPNPCENGKCSNFTAVNYNCSCFDGWQGRNCTEDVDECSLKTDRCNRTAGSTCTNTNGSYVCECGSGYEGRYCDDDIDECQPRNPCLYKGICRNRRGSYECFCSPGYRGKNCSENIDECKLEGHEKCKNGICKDLVNKYECVCYVGWKERHCDADINECDLGFCKNNAPCNNTLGNYTCTCQPGYTDLNCSTDIDECSSNPCQNNGVCDDRVNGYKCNCTHGYEGQSCEFDIDWCNETRYNGSKPCTSHGTSHGNCTDQLLNYTCDCFVGFMGRNCQIDLDECEVKPCKNGATCIQKSNDTAIAAHFGRNKMYPPNERGGYLCICMPGYNGTNCENDIDECQLYKPCNSTGTKMCNDAINDYNCTCKPGFTGRNCSTDIDECASSPCENNGTCLDLPAKFSCNCTANFTGSRCEKQVDPCTARQPCRNGGTCMPNDYNFTCACAAGFAGDTCVDKTTLGFDGTTSSMTLRIGEASTLNVSLSFQTNFPGGVLLSESSKWTLALKSGNLEVMWLNSVLFVLGFGGGFSDSRWHSVSLVVNEVSISAIVGNATCVQRCSNKSDIPLTLTAALSSGTQLVVGGTSGRAGFTGSIRDLAVNDVTYYPGVSGVNATNVIPGFQRQNVCTPMDPCVHGTCKDLWTKYECVCDRNWTGKNCTEDVQWGTFGVISRLNNGYVTKGKESYAKYSLSTSFKTLAFSMRTRSSSSVVVLLYLNTSVYLSVETSNGVLQLRYNSSIISLGKTGVMKVDNASYHYINISRSAIQIDNTSYDVTVPPLAIQDVFVGGVQEGYLSGGLGAMAPYRGCIRDVRLNGEQLLFFNQTAGQWNRTQKNIALGCAGEDVCGNLSGNGTCLNNGNCTDLWNLHRCDCPWPYGGDNCEHYGCEWTNPCPRNATCVNLKKTSEYKCIAKATLNGSQSIVSFTNSTPLPDAQSLVAQFRTRQNTSSILVSSENNGSFFEITIQDGRLIVSYKLKENLTETVNTNVFVSDGQWHEVKLQSNANETKFSISTMELLGAQTKYSLNTTFVRNSSILNEAFSNLVATAGIHLGSPSNKTTGVHLVGCLREIRIGNQLLSLVANFTTDDTKPGFSRADSAFSVRHLKHVTYGCQGNPVCTGSVCGAGECVDRWNDFSCACPKGYRGRFCERSPCSPSPCNYGNCSVSSDGAFKCACPPDYGGTLCDDPCASTPCKNGGKCEKSANGSFDCACEDGWSGQLCIRTTAAPRPSEDDDDNSAMIIGLSVAGGCLLLIIIVAICLCTRQTSSTFGTYSPRGEEKLGVGVEMSPVLNVPPPEKLI